MINKTFHTPTTTTTTEYKLAGRDEIFNSLCTEMRQVYPQRCKLSIPGIEVSVRPVY